MKTKSILILAALTVSLAACNKSKSKEVVPVNVVTVEEVVPEPETPAVDPAVALKEFKAFAKSYGEAFNNITKNPGNYSKLAGQVQSKWLKLRQLRKISLRRNRRNTTKP
ncbi:hypothetical protein AGMMS49965_23720 [Bacteroidia bacterium]|nr:hypothetical protein AGMMS49965_23720 [Bacteroidia bacterium]